MNQIIYQVDAFTTRPFSGNPAGVCALKEEAEDAWMQSVAMEMNLSETAFLVPHGNAFHLRWFTPKKEVRLCGHATLASAHILWETGTLREDQPACFDTLSGRLTAHQRGDWIDMDFPARFEQPAPPPDGLLEALGIQAQYVGLSNNTYLVEVESESVVRACQPDFAWLNRLPLRSVVVTARSETPDFDFVSRYFAPSMGVNEDPVTGSAHCILTPFWSTRLGKEAMSAYQASLRGGALRVRLAGERVILSGQAVTVLTGELKTGVES